MPTLTPTAATGARSQPQEMTYVDPTRTMMPDEDQAFLANTGPARRSKGPRQLVMPGRNGR